MSIENVISCAVFISAIFIISLIPLFVGIAKKRNIVKTVEFCPPRGASPVDVLIQYYGKHANPRDLFNPLMLYWAERGFITIEEDCKRGLKLTKLKDIECPERGEGFNWDTYELEKNLFERIFGKRKVFYTLGANNYFAEFYQRIMQSCKAAAESVSGNKTKIYSVLTVVLSAVLVIFVIVFVGITMEIDDSERGIIGVMVFPVFALFMFRFAPEAFKTDGAPSTVAYFIYPFCAMFGGVPLAVVLALIPLEAAIFLVIAFAVAAFMLFFVAKKIDLRDGEQLKIYAKICGFKNFLLLAERAKLEALVEDNPEYFYEILPYCYVLGITQKLKPKFDRIVMDGPGWYLGELRDTLMF